MSITEERPLNGVDTPKLFATIDAVREHPEAAAFQFRSQTQWLSGTHTQSRFPGFYGAGEEHTHTTVTVVDADHPAVLVGTDAGPTPAELLLSALGACLTAGLGNIAAARGIELREVRCRIEGDIDLRGILGLDGSVRNGFSGITALFEVDADADDEQVRSLVTQARGRSAVYDVLTAGTTVDVRFRDEDS